MQIQVVTLFPQMFSALSDHGVTGRAIHKGLVQLGMINPRDYTHDRHNTVDARPYGGGPGMVMMVEPLREAIGEAKKALGDHGKKAKVIYLSPQGRKLDQEGLQSLAQNEEMILLCGRYEGIDERLIASEVDEEWSIGDYVLSGGELAAMVLIDGVTRLIPGALGHEDSAEQDSFMNGLLDTPHYTRPEILDDSVTMAVPDVLLSGNHKNIERWRLKQALGRTWLRRPDLLEKLALNQAEEDLLAEFIRETELDSTTNR
ncbi:MAG: tRNA (guanosine(37)-N1)-methyltransferase TrmD [Gammaproteobacteria bacterium]|nr:tRNA (guanosine(37)-N1)-methyltransferase TrmD [Gammaproteobacteria bacterium]MCW8986199.1 tRNA (guanosine(37)-N1)-methyltransferase TrmD [Gammaproteobacteria bacterium]MCW9031955.1 tRNA (guanosine(37)-N1)-methyltransferase TrmD [Gammaproteobacteria bacterium]